MSCGEKNHDFIPAMVCSKEPFSISGQVPGMICRKCGLSKFASVEPTPGVITEAVAEYIKSKARSKKR